MDQYVFNQRLQQLRITTEPDEEVFEIIHKHWGRIIPSFLGLGALAALTLLIIGTALTLGAFSAGDALFFVLVILWYLVLAAYGISEWHSHSRSALILTNKRILDVEQTNFFSRRIQGSDIHQLQSCTGQVDAGLGSIFNYGNIWINTVGDAPFCVSHLPLPEVVSGEILHYHNLIAHGGESIHGVATEAAPAQVLKAIEATPTDDQLEPFLDRADPSSLKPSKKTPPIHKTQAVAYSPNFYETIQETDLKPLPRPGKIKRKTMTLLMFHLPSENLARVLQFIPSQKEPTVTYLAHSDCYEIEVIVADAKVPILVERLRNEGGHNFTCHTVEMIE